MTKRILNLTNHTMTGAQIEELTGKWGYEEIIELTPEDKAEWAAMDPTNYKEVCQRILSTYQVEGIHLAGFPVAVAYVVSKFRNEFELLYAYSGRDSVEEHLPDGTVVKKNIFRHKGFFNYLD